MAVPKAKPKHSAKDLPNAPPRALRLAVALCAVMATTTTQAQEDLTLTSQMPDLTVTQTADLPESEAITETEATPPCIISPNQITTQAGQQLAALGWLITTEIVQNDLTIISFAEAATPSTSSTCLLYVGKIAIFQGDRLHGLIHSGEDPAQTIGSLTAINSESLRIWNGDFLPAPLGDLQILELDQILVTAVAKSDSFCDDSLTLPNLYGLPIKTAREILFKDGWLAPTASVAENLTAGAAASTLPELDSCAGYRPWVLQLPLRQARQL